MEELECIEEDQENTQADMAVRERLDRSGVPYTLYYDSTGLPYPIQPQVKGDYACHLSDVKNMNLRHDDVIQLGYPKSGNHWLFEILTMLVYHSHDYTHHTLGNNIIDGVPVEELDAMTSPRVLVSHLRTHCLPQQLFDKKVKIVLVLRNPKDVLISLYAFVSSIHICAPYRGSFDDFFELFLSGTFAHGSWTEYARECDEMLARHPTHPIHIVTYEEMKQDPVREVKRLCKFLGYKEIRDEFVLNVVQKTDFHIMSHALNSGKLASMKYVFDEGAPGLFRKGTVGEWRHWFSESQNESFDRIFEEQTKDVRLIDRIRQYL